MAESEKLIYSIRELFSEFLRGRKFNIPSYQRGYKWTPDNVVTLLNDLKKFNPSENDFYCLQNITVTDGDGNKLNVIDGQQRLTTVFLLLSYLGEVGKTLPNGDCLLYSVRESTHKFLQAKVAARSIWSSEIYPGKAGHKDEYYIARACKAIDEWFKHNAEEKDVMREKILNRLKVIVNYVDPGEEELVFSGLNGGKVNLDGADLVRAILITRAARQRYPDTEENREKIGSFRAKLGLELDSAAQWWGRKDVFQYFKQLLPNGLTKNHNFDAEAYRINLLYYAFYEAYRDKFTKNVKSENLDVRLFENGVDFNSKSGDDHLEFYEKISEFNLTMQDWFRDAEIFNLVGYLMYNFKSRLSFADLWTLWTSESVRTKPDFVRKLKILIRKCLALVFEPSDKTWSEIGGEEIDVRFDKLLKHIQQHDANWYYSRDLIYPVLAIADILPIEYGDTTQTKPQRADIFDFARQDKEDIEHIRSQKRKLYTINPDELTPEEEQALEEENKKGLNSLGNLVLLHRTINRSYQNDGMDLKMDRIFGEAALNEIHIRPYTQSVFRSKLKKLDRNSEYVREIFWSDEDVKHTAKSLADRIQKYLSI